MKYPETIFFIGKGGTGKSTTSALISLMFANTHKKVGLASFDYAHNQSDIFEKNLSDKAYPINPFLKVLQINRDKEIKKYLKDTLQNVKKTYSYLTAFNLGDYFDVLKFSPGMEEYALVTAFLNVRKQFMDYDYLIIDMPPTAVALRFFNLPSLSLAWIEQLEKLRMEIYKKKEIISKIKIAGKEFERDKVLSKIREIKETYITLKNIFQTKKKSTLYIVFNHDLLSINETKRIIEDLNNFHINTAGLICNNRQNNSDTSDLKDMPLSGQIKFLPFSDTPLIGEIALQKFIQANNLSTEKVLNLKN
ncbi:MAG: TRC40/GET3/ArsA family transport-energizing ATPase [Desulfobacteraceae bacterium]|nr:TRC40/GET3/ArsA family transport-energizing ATPase [Desulfobacteraceae bacterium]